jgi:hypothetical protein
LPGGNTKYEFNKRDKNDTTSSIINMVGGIQIKINDTFTVPLFCSSHRISHGNLDRGTVSATNDGFIWNRVVIGIDHGGLFS